MATLENLAALYNDSWKAHVNTIARTMPDASSETPDETIDALDALGERYAYGDEHIPAIGTPRLVNSWNEAKTEYERLRTRVRRGGPLAGDTFEDLLRTNRRFEAELALHIRDTYTRADLTGITIGRGDGRTLSEMLFF